jgi:predicted DNA-binding transcriptional regulator AlpA
VQEEVFVTFPELPAHGIKFCRLHINRLMERRQFPAAIWLSQNRKVWRLSEIERFLATRPTVRPAFPAAEGVPDATD